MKRRYLVPTALVLGLLLGSTPTHAQDLNVYLAASSDALGAGDAVDFTLMASNTGAAALENVRVELQLSQQYTEFRTFQLIGGNLDCSSSSFPTFCSPGETLVWNIGTLAPGENLHLTYPTRIANDPPSGDATTQIIASADNSSDIIQMHVVAVDSSPLLRLSLVPDPGPAVPGEPFTYTLTYGNVGSSNPTSVELTMPVPEGTSFLSATEGGAESGGTVTWPLGTVGVGAGGRVEMTVVPDAGLASGATLDAEASLDSGVATELIVRSEAVTEVGPREALRFDYALSQNAITSNGFFTYTLTATNISTTGDLTNVRTVVRLPQQINDIRTFSVVGSGLDCSSASFPTFCSPGEVIAWNVGTLAPGQSRTILMPAYIAADAQQGEVLRASYYATADGLGEQTGGVDLVVDPSPVTQLRLIPGPGPAVRGEPFTYTLLFGNIGFQPADLALRMKLPDDATFVSATGGGVESDGTVTWLAPSVATEAVGRIQVTVEVDDDLPDGALLEASAKLDTGSSTEYAVYASAAIPVRSGIPLVITYSGDLDAGQPGDPFTLTMVAENTGPADLTDVRAAFRLPNQFAEFLTSQVVGDGLDCSSASFPTFCSPGEVIAWNVGTLAPGQSRTILMPTGLASTASEGSLVVSPLVATATGSNEVLRNLTVLVGEQVTVSNEPSTAETFALGMEAYPTPFARSTTFALSLPEEGDVRLTVYDVLGRAVGTVVEEAMAAGRHEVQWDAHALPSGLYFYRFDAGRRTLTGSIVKVR